MNDKIETDIIQLDEDTEYFLIIRNYAGVVFMVSYYNPPFAFSSAWASSGERGPEFLDI